VNLKEVVEFVLRSGKWFQPSLYLSSQNVFIDTSQKHKLNRMAKHSRLPGTSKQSQPQLPTLQNTATTSIEKEYEPQ